MLKKSGKNMMLMMLDVYLEWKKERVDKIKVIVEVLREECIKNNLFMGCEIIE